MKKVFTTINAVLVTVLFLFSCQKEIKESQAITTSDDDAVSVNSANKEGKNSCRLVFSRENDAVGTYDKSFHYNAAGLCDEWTIIDGSGHNVYTQEYNKAGKLVGSKWFLEGTLMNTIVFTYKKSRLIKETWYVTNTNDIWDEIWFTYNAQGKMVRNESFLNGWYGIYKYSPQGNVLSAELFFGDSPFFTSINTYDRPVKNPYLAVPGIDHFFPYYLPSIPFSKWRNSAEKEIVYDIDGTPIVWFDYDPAQTIWQVGHENYALSTTYYDRLSAGLFNNTFDYENCEGGHGNKQPTPPPTVNLNDKRPDNPSLLRINPSLPVKEQFNRLRTQLKNRMQK